MFNNCFRDRTVWLSGNTGFKGAWLAEWLGLLGARVHGYALPPEDGLSLFAELGHGARFSHEFADLRDAECVRRSLVATQPDFVFHLGAQAIVRVGYESPVETYATNVLGTIHVMEGLRTLAKPCAAVFVTSDKCYENREWHYGYRENDHLGGYDPYSSSKGAAEIAIASWRRSFFQGHAVRLASGRAGNVIGGGDWARDRIVPDCIRSLLNNQPIRVRRPRATRPWQHVLEPLSGYLWLAACLDSQRSEPAVDCSALDGAFNFGPGHDANRTVGELVAEVLQHWPGEWQDVSNSGDPHEAAILQVCTDKAKCLLGWSPAWSFAKAVQKTVDWYHCAALRRRGDCDSLRAVTVEQIQAYQCDAAAISLRWAVV